MRRSGILVAAFISAILLVGASCAKTASTPQTLRAVLAVEPGQIDPALASAVQEVTVVKQVFRGLMNFDSTLKLKADVAREIPTVANKGVSQDGLTYTFKLRPEVSWSDGKKVVARDFEYGIKRMLSPETASSYASSYFSIAGAEAYNGGKGDAASVGVKALDDVTLQVKLAEPTTTFLQLMALWPAYPVREDIISRFGKKWTDPPNYVGNGPFVLAERVANDHITLKANPNYWANKSKLGEIQVKVIGDGNAMLSAYRNNEVDIAPVLTGNERAVIEDAVLGKEVLRYPALSTFGFIFNNTVAPFDNVKVRRAITTAIDRESFINSVRSGVGKPATSWIPPGMPGFDASLGSQYKFDAAKARQLLAEAGYPDPTKLPPIRFQYAGATNKTIAEFLQGQMKSNLGIDITLEALDGRAFGQLMGSRKFSWAAFLWNADYPDPDNWLPDLFGTGAGNNLGGYSNAAFDSLAKQARSELDNPKRLQLLAQAHKIVVDDAPVAFMYYRERIVLVKPSVKGLTTTGMDAGIAGDQFFDLVSISK